jgi:GNAT superfamily N-acetyltransferase
MHMQIQVEKFRNCIKQMNDIILEYYAKTVGGDGMPPIDMAWETFTELEANDRMILITARDETNHKLIAFVTYYLLFNQNHKTIPMAACGTLATRLDYRGQGIASKLLHTAEALLRMYDVKQIVHGHRSVYDVEPIFTKHGYKVTEVMYMKEL